MGLSFCPIPHTTREQVWLGVGAVAGICLAQALFARKRTSGAEPEEPEFEPTFERPDAEPPLVRLTSGLSGRTQILTNPTPKRLFKLARKSEVDTFMTEGIIESSLDKADGFCHLSDRTSPKTVAALFFKGVEDLHILEIDSTMLDGPVQWILSTADDPPLTPNVIGSASTTVHYIIAKGCVHVYESKVNWSAVTRPPQHCPLDENGEHVLPNWL